MSRHGLKKLEKAKNKMAHAVLNRVGFQLGI